MLVSSCQFLALATLNVLLTKKIPIHRFVSLKFLIEKKPAYLDFDIPIFVYRPEILRASFAWDCGWIRAGRHPFVCIKPS